jgi:hypothetical protein
MRVERLEQPLAGGHGTRERVRQQRIRDGRQVIAGNEYTVLGQEEREALAAVAGSIDGEHADRPACELFSRCDDAVDAKGVGAPRNSPIVCRGFKGLGRLAALDLAGRLAPGDDFGVGEGCDSARVVEIGVREEQMASAVGAPLCLQSEVVDLVECKRGIAHERVPVADSEHGVGLPERRLELPGARFQVLARRARALLNCWETARGHEAP